MKSLLILISLFLSFSAGHFCTLNACNRFLKERVPIVRPAQEPVHFYRFGDIELQIDSIKEQGKEELIQSWDEWSCDLYPWDVITGGL